MALNNNAGNAHWLNSNTLESSKKIAANGASLQSWTLLTLDGSFVRYALPGEVIEWVSFTRKDFDGDNETGMKETALYYRLYEKDTFLIDIVPWTVATDTMVWMLIDINADQYLDVATAWTWTQFRVECLTSSGKDLEVSVVKQPQPPVITATQDSVAIATPGQTVLPLSATPLEPLSVVLLVNHIQALQWVHYTISGNTIVWDTVAAWYELLPWYDIQVNYTA